LQNGFEVEIAMKRPDKPAYWQLDLFIFLMIALIFLIMRINIALQWETLVEVGWAALTIGGMTLWVWTNWSALREEEQEQRAGRQQVTPETDTLQARDRQLTPVQRRFLDAMRRHERK
jgi:hypothetical protein